MRSALHAGGYLVAAFALASCSGDNFAPVAGGASAAGSAGSAGGVAGQSAKGGAGGTSAGASSGAAGTNATPNGGASGTGGNGGSSASGGATAGAGHGGATAGAGQGGASSNGGAGGNGASSANGGASGKGGVGGTGASGKGGSAGNGATAGSGGNGAGATTAGSGGNGAGAATGGDGGTGASAGTGGDGGTGATAGTGGSDAGTGGADAGTGGAGATGGSAGSTGGPPTDVCPNGSICGQPGDPCSKALCGLDNVCYNEPKPAAPLPDTVGNCLATFCDGESTVTQTRPDFLDPPKTDDATCYTSYCDGGSPSFYDDTLRCPSGRCLDGTCDGVCAPCPNGSKAITLRNATACSLTSNATLTGSNGAGKPLENVRDGFLDTSWEAATIATEADPTKVQTTFLGGSVRMTQVHVRARNLATKPAVLHYTLKALVGISIKTLSVKRAVAAGESIVLSFDLTTPQEVKNLTVEAWSPDTVIAIDEIATQNCFKPLGGGGGGPDQ